MFSEKIRPPVILLIASVLLLIAELGVSPRATAQNSTASELLQIAEESLEAQYETLVTGDADKAVQEKRFARRFSAAIRNKLSSQQAIRLGLRKTRQVFKGFRTKLVLKEIQINNDKAQLKATEITELALDTPPGGPKVTKSSDPHVFNFVKSNGEWHLVSDLVVTPAPVLAKADQPSTPLPPPLSTRLAVSRKHHAELNHSVRPFVNYDRVAAVDYAKAHALSYNPAFKRFNNDCTNFVSQTLLAGGWQMALGVYTHNDVWWYSCMLPGGNVCRASYTWGAAFNFHEFLGTSPGQRTNMADHFGDVWPGDIIFADWDGPTGHHPDGRIDHVMVVTGRDTDGNLYISQHTNDRLNRPMTQVILQETEANFYGFRIKDSY